MYVNGGMYVNVNGLQADTGSLEPGNRQGGSSIGAKCAWKAKR
jgi:hypothetical protein